MSDDEYACPTCSERGYVLPEDRFVDDSRMYYCENDDCERRKYRAGGR